MENAPRNRKRTARQLTKWKRTFLEDNSIPALNWDSDDSKPGPVGQPEGDEGVPAGDVGDEEYVDEWRDEAGGEVPEVGELDEGQVDDHAHVGRPHQGADVFRVDDDLDSFIGYESDDDVGVVAVRPELQVSPPPCDGVDAVCEFLVGIQSRRGVPEKVMRDVVDYLRANGNVVSKSLTEGTLPNFRTMKQQVLRRAPPVKLDISYRKEGVVFTDRGLKSFPKLAMSKVGVDHLYTFYYVSLAAVLGLHARLHPQQSRPDELDISIDGVPESKSGGRSVEILSVRFIGCRGIYSLGLLQPTRRGLGIGEEVILQHFLEELEETGLRVRRVIADAPKRAAIRGLKQHSAKFACPYCKASKEHGAFAARSFGADLRTDGEVRAIAARLEADDFSSDEDREEVCRGIKKVSPLASLSYLDLIRDIPCEPMHLIHLGIVRRILNLSFMCGSSKAKDVTFKRASDEALNAALLRTKSLPEFSRRTRRLDLANYKAEEFRNVVMGFWPAFLNALPTKTVTTWILTVYLVRAFNLPRRDLQELMDRVDLKRTLKFWYEEYEHAYGTVNCSYNVHVFSHLDLVCAVDDLSELSAVDYEDQYNLLKRSYRPGTTSIGTQALQNLNVGKFYKHSCRKPRTVSLMATDRVEDRYVFTSDKKIVLLTAIDGDAMTGRVVPVAPGLFVGAGLDLTDVWCFRKADVAEDTWETVQISPNNVVGKCVFCEGIFSAFTFQMLTV